MRFLRWYGGLTKKAFKVSYPGQDKKFSDFLYEDISKIGYMLIWAMVTSFIGTVLAMSSLSLWSSLPEPVRNYTVELANMAGTNLAWLASTTWFYLVIFAKSVWLFLIWFFGGAWFYLVASVKSVWAFLDPVKPAFVWFFSLDYKLIFYWVFKILFHLVIALMAMNFAMALLDSFRLLLFRMSPKDNKGVVAGFIYLCVCIFVGYYVTTSSYGVAAANFMASIGAY